MKTKKLIALLLSAAALLSLAACTENGTNGTASTDVPQSTNGGKAPENSDKTTADSTEAQVVDPTPVYRVNEEEKAALADENTARTIEFVGFDSHCIIAPALNGGESEPSMSVLYSPIDVSNFINENKTKYDTSAAAKYLTKYDETYFKSKALIVASFGDSDGSNDYSVTGAWEDVLEGEGFSLKELVFAAKRTGSASSNSNVFIFIELDRSFTYYWDSFYINLYN